MLTVEQLTELSRVTGSPDEPVVSVYLNLDRWRSDRRGHRLVVRDLVRNLEAEAQSKRARKTLRRDLERIARFLDLELEPRGRGLVIFSCAARDFWQVHHLPMPLGDLAYLDTSPCIRPLLNALDQHPRYAVVVVDKERARFFVAHLGEMVEYGEILDPLPRKHKQGGWSQANFQRHHETHVTSHLKSVADTVERYRATMGFDRLVIGGTEELVAALLRLLPRSLASLLAGTFAITAAAPLATIQREVEALHNRMEQVRKNRLVDELVATAKKGGPAVLGLRDTVTALNWGQVWRLVIDEQVHVSGYDCPSCHRLVTEAQASCSACGARLAATQDLAGKMIQSALNRDARVEVLHEGGIDVLAPHGGIGAFLRF